MYSWRESLDMCSMRCKWWGHDMDDAYCGHPSSMEKSNGFGLSLNTMIRIGLCTGCSDDPTKNKKRII